MDSVSIVRDSSLTGSDIVGDLRLDWSVYSDVGRVRDANEDAALVLPGRYLLADGMGGHESGELASEAALLTLAEVEPGAELAGTRDALDQLLVDAQQRIGGIDGFSDRRAGTTVTGAVLVTDDDVLHWLILNIGDSRTYRFQNGTLQLLTRDHSQVQEFVDAGVITAEQARIDPRRNVITRALGAGMAEPDADYFSTPALPGDVLLICSDGLTGELPDAEIAEILAGSDSVEDAAASLVDAALFVGAHDNVTVVVVAVRSDEESDEADGENTETSGETPT
ncbi:protein phosphatase 2C domain-containing protein [Gordonia sp. w5E2]|uniref:Protein phosphatase n=1 Tax=Gordonia jacobaea TaxID=122202 RepID=A0ABR5IHT1_9ACTN|nr:MULTISPECIES: protein phosphatase 2C domain-containing protein [Gordonia]KNA93144.1 protein phosphatase [Gordonia jacobaea]SKY44460.1 serine/threonine protein phosphatase [Mycobacteroides abscessus subsp. abscessus]